MQRLAFHQTEAQNKRDGELKSNAAKHTGIKKYIISSFTENRPIKLPLFG